MHACPPARVVKLVDTGDLKSPDRIGRAGSIPASGTMIPQPRSRELYEPFMVARQLRIYLRGCHPYAHGLYAQAAQWAVPVGGGRSL